MTMGREWQGMFAGAKEKMVKCAVLARYLNNDIQGWADEGVQESLRLLKVPVPQLT